MSNRKATHEIYSTSDLEKRLANFLNMPELGGVLDVIKQDSTSTAPPYDAQPGRASMEIFKAFIKYLRSLIFGKMITKMNIISKNLIITLLCFMILTSFFLFFSKEMVIKSFIFYANECTPPPSGDWITTESCTLLDTAAVIGNVYIEDDALLTIEQDAMLCLE